MDFQVPELGEGVYEAELVAWQVKPGDAVRRGQTLMEVLTDKATMEVPSPFAGTVTALSARPGQQIKVGEVQAVLANSHVRADAGRRTLSAARNRAQSARTRQRSQSLPSA